MNIKLFRRVQTILSIILFIGVFFLCWNITGFKITEIQLSFWGADTKYPWIWNSCVNILSLSIFINTYLFIKNHTRLDIRYTKFNYITFGLTSLFLLIVGSVNLHHEIHNVSAYLYFFSYPLFIFLFAHLNRKSMQYKEWKTHVIFSISMVVGPVLVLKFFPGMAISEIIHSIFVISWNIWILTLD